MPQDEAVSDEMASPDDGQYAPLRGLRSFSAFPEGRWKRMIADLEREDGATKELAAIRACFALAAAIETSFSETL